MGSKVSDRDRWRFHHLLPDTRGDQLGWSVHSINVDPIGEQQLYQGNIGSFLDDSGVNLARLKILQKKKLHREI